MTLVEIAKESNLDEIKEKTSGKYIVSPNLKEF